MTGIAATGANAFSRTRTGTDTRASAQTFDSREVIRIRQSGGCHDGRYLLAYSTIACIHSASTTRFLWPTIRSLSTVCITCANSPPPQLLWLPYRLPSEPRSIDPSSYATGCLQQPLRLYLSPPNYVSSRHPDCQPPYSLRKLPHSNHKHHPPQLPPHHVLFRRKCLQPTPSARSLPSIRQRQPLHPLRHPRPVPPRRTRPRSLFYFATNGCLARS
jgi:hypothetical protein